MSDIDRAKAALRGHSVAVCRAGEVMTRNGRGIAPLLVIASEASALRGASVADLIVGKAAALLMAYAGVSEVYAEVMSEAGERTLSEHDIPHSCGLLVPYIIDRTGKDISRSAPSPTFPTPPRRTRRSPHAWKSCAAPVRQHKIDTRRPTAAFSDAARVG